MPTFSRDLLSRLSIDNVGERWDTSVTYMPAVTGELVLAAQL
jgi:hypothetical protein